MLMGLDEAEKGWKCQDIIIMNYFTVALSIVLILSITEKSAKQDNSPKLSVFFLCFYSFLLSYLSVFPPSSPCLLSISLNMWDNPHVSPLCLIAPFPIYFNPFPFPPMPRVTLFISCSSCSMNIAWIIDLSVFCLLDWIYLPDCSIYWCKVCKIKAA